MKAQPKKLTARGEQRRTSLVVAARAVFEGEGVAGATIAQIAAAAGTAIGSFYTYFETKEDVLRAVIEAVESEFAIGLPKDVGPDGLARIEAGNRLYVQNYARNARILAVLQHESFSDSTLLGLRQKSRKRWVDRAERSIKRLQVEGQAGSDVSSRFLAEALSSMVQAFCYENFVFGGAGFSEDEAAAGLTMIWIRALNIHSPTNTGKRRIRR